VIVDELKVHPERRFEMSGVSNLVLMGVESELADVEDEEVDESNSS